MKEPMKASKSKHYPLEKSKSFAALRLEENDEMTAESSFTEGSEPEESYMSNESELAESSESNESELDESIVSSDSE